MSRAGVVENSASSTATHRYAHVDAMRALAVVLVVLAHAGLGDIVPGGSGVTIFFAISGFIITNLLLKERSKSGGFDIRAFYVRRILKIFPPFLVVIAIPTLILSFFKVIHWDLFFSQVLFYFNWIYMTNGDAGLLPGSGVVWSLSIEEQFYIAFAIIWLAAVRSKDYLKILTVIASIGVAAPLAIRLFIALTDFSHSRIYYGTDTRLDAISIGILAAIFYFKAQNSDYNLARIAKMRQFFEGDKSLVLAFILYFSSLVIRDDIFRETVRYSMQACAAALVILYGLLVPTKTTIPRRVFSALTKLRLIKLIGLASYSIYLVHLQLTMLTETTLSDYMGPILIVLNTIFGIVAGYAIWWMVERPAERYKKRLYQTAPTPLDDLQK